MPGFVPPARANDRRVELGDRVGEVTAGVALVPEQRFAACSLAAGDELGERGARSGRRRAGTRGVAQAGKDSGALEQTRPAACTSGGPGQKLPADASRLLRGDGLAPPRDEARRERLSLREGQGARAKAAPSEEVRTQTPIAPRPSSASIR